jgi:Protein of unknown function (DUF3047)
MSPPYVAATLMAAALVFESFESGWEHRWISRELGSNRNRVTVEQVDGEAILRIDSASSAGMQLHELAIDALPVGEISWRWKVTAPLAGTVDEAEKEADDYAARLFVIFDPLPLGPKSRALCYVWASTKPTESVYPSPYSESVATIVVESGADSAGRWVREHRNFLMDYKRFFGEDPKAVTAIAVMVDTDNTGATATTWFDDILLE